jgi:hypothetical protein
MFLDQRLINPRVFSFMVGTLSLCLASSSHAYERGKFDISFGFGYNTQSIGNGSFAINKRIGGSVGYFIFPVTEVELAYQYSVERTKILNFQDTTFYDSVFTGNVTQYVFPKHWPVQPYLKLGLGQLNRIAEGSYAFGAAPAAELASLTVVMGFGVRFYITRFIAVRTELTSYLAGGAISTFTENMAVNMGLSVVF